ncbi:amino acid permease-domain-containing protein [Phakopsora pachyrhizi]|uniref:Amino acid permease-domain-containing protein n=1 Tax=Phakopsora pachyrhizi TaxID=170000 RepID=A0AAV0BP62_PHAPC|nr:amino acid permease-domain-containing protein [Phakopsora pachyrhizi]
MIEPPRKSLSISSLSSASSYDDSDRDTIRFVSEPQTLETTDHQSHPTFTPTSSSSALSASAASAASSSLSKRSPPTTLIQPISVHETTTDVSEISQQSSTQSPNQALDQIIQPPHQDRHHISPTLLNRILPVPTDTGPAPSPTDQSTVPQPQNFLSGASKRLPELQHHLKLNPEFSFPNEAYPASESDPLLVHSEHHPSLLDHQGPDLGCRTCLVEGNSSDARNRSSSHPNSHPRPLYQSRPSRTLNTFDGVFLPTVLSILNALYFMRFGYCIGQIGLLGTLALLLIAYLINVLTVFSLSAIATNGQVRGGGAYYLISRTLGPEFGGSIGILFCLSQALTAAMNIIGFVEAFLDISYLGLHPDGRTPDPVDSDSASLHSVTSLERYAMRSSVLLAATIGCILLGWNKIFSGLARSITMVLLISLLSVLFSFLTKRPFFDESLHVRYTSFSLETFKQNLYPSYVTFRGNKGLAVVVTPRFSDYQKVFGILFSSLSSILAGSSLSGELRKPGKSIPLGMSLALVCIAVIYLFTLLGLSITSSRTSFVSLNPDGLLNLIIYQISSYPIIMGFGILLCTLFSSLMGIIVCAKTLQAVSRDGLLPLLKPFFSQGRRIGDDPLYSITFCYVICQLAIIYNINKIAVHITTISLLVFVCINLACFTLRISGSPNFRPSFRLFSEWTALLGLILAFVFMYLVDPVSASTCLVVMIIIFVSIHYSSPAKQWGEVTQSIIYHQVRKYLLRLDERKDNVKYWRPQILLFTNDPRHDWNQIVFCNSLKKGYGGLYVLAHIIKSEFSAEAIKELQEQQLNWLGLVDISKIKAFVDITVAPDERLGARQLLLTAGLGGMRPNICILGFPTNLKWRGKGKLVEAGDSTRRGSKITRARRRSDSSMTVKGMIIESTSEVAIDCLGSLPTDSQRSETPIKPVDFVGIIEDSLNLNKSVGLTYGFQGLRLPESISKPQSERSQEGDKAIPAANQAFQSLEKQSGKRWIDLWPILREGESAWETYTMVLQLGTVLSLVPTWRNNHALRVTIFCEQESEILEEQRRMERLLSDLRIRATLRICVLGNGQIESYQCLVKGKVIGAPAWRKLERTLAGDPWWETLKFMRGQDYPMEPNENTSQSTRPSNRSPTVSDRTVDKALLNKNSQTNNIRIKALHPLSRRGSRQNSENFSSMGYDRGQENGIEDDGEPIFEENDGDDDTIARAAYSRNKKSSIPFAGLPDEPQIRSATTAHQFEIKDYGSILGHQSLDLDNLSLSFISEGKRPNNFLHNRRGSNSASPSSSKDPEQRNTLSPAFFKKVSLRRKAPKSISAAFHRKNLLKGQSSLLSRKNNRDEEPRASSSTNEASDGYGATNGSRSSSNTTTSSNEDGFNSNNESGADRGCSDDPSGLPAIELDFNSIPMRAQLICLNELIRFNSDDETAIIFTSLPPPEIGSSNSYEGSLRYLDQLESFLEGLPPVLAIYAKQFTVT